MRLAASPRTSEPAWSSAAGWEAAADVDPRVVRDDVSTLRRSANGMARLATAFVSFVLVVTLAVGPTIWVLGGGVRRLRLPPAGARRRVHLPAARALTR